MASSNQRSNLERQLESISNTAKEESYKLTIEKNIIHGSIMYAIHKKIQKRLDILKQMDATSNLSQIEKEFQEELQEIIRSMNHVDQVTSLTLRNYEVGSRIFESLQSLAEERKKIVNEKGVGELYPELYQQQLYQQQIYQQQHQMYLQLGRMNVPNGRVPPPAPPKRNDCTQLTSPK